MADGQEARSPQLEAHEQPVVFDPADTGGHQEVNNSEERDVYLCFSLVQCIV